MRVSRVVQLILGVFTASRQVYAFVASHHSLATRQNAAAARTRSKLAVMGPELVTDVIHNVDRITGSSQILADYPLSPEPIRSAFKAGTFYGQPFFLLMILFPKSSITKKIMGGLEIPLGYAVLHFFIVASSIALQGSGVTAPLAEFNDVFDPAKDSQLAFMGMVSKYPNFVAEEWTHVLCWDLFVGRYIWLDGLKRGIFTAPAVLFCNLIGPPGLLIHFLTCILTGKPIVDPSVKEEIEKLD